MEFENGELVQDNLDEGTESTVSNETEDNDLDEGEEAAGAGENEDQGGDEGENLLAGKYKTFGGLAQAYVDQRRKLGMPVDLQNYATDKALEKAFLRDKARLGGGQESAQTDTEGEDLETMDAADLLNLLQTQQAQIMQSVGMVPAQQNGQGQVPQGQPQQGFVQAPNQGYPLPYQQTPQGGQQKLPPMKPHTYDNWIGDPEEWFNNELLMKGPKAILEMVREEIDRQGPQLGYALANILGPMSQQVQEVRSQVDYDREAKSLNRELKRQGDSLDNYEDEIAAAYKQYPGLAHIEGGMRKALELAKTMKAINSKKAKKQVSSKAGVRMPSAGGSGIPKAQTGKALSPEDDLYERLVKKR